MSPDNAMTPDGAMTPNQALSERAERGRPAGPDEILARARATAMHAGGDRTADVIEVDWERRRRSPGRNLLIAAAAILLVVSGATVLREGLLDDTAVIESGPADPDDPLINQEPDDNDDGAVEQDVQDSTASIGASVPIVVVDRPDFRIVSGFERRENAIPLTEFMGQEIYLDPALGFDGPYLDLARLDLTDSEQSEASFLDPEQTVTVDVEGVPASIATSGSRSTLELVIGEVKYALFGFNLDQEQVVAAAAGLVTGGELTLPDGLEPVDVTSNPTLNSSEIMTSTYEFEAGQLTGTVTVREADLSELYAGATLVRWAGAEFRGVTIGGHDALLYHDGSEARAMWWADGFVFGLEVTSGESIDQLGRVLPELVILEGRDAALPEDWINEDSLQETIDAIIGDTPRPEDSAAGPVEDYIRVGPPDEVVRSVAAMLACIWASEWGDARAAGDTETASAAEAAVDQLTRRMVETHPEAWWLSNLEGAAASMAEGRDPLDHFDDDFACLGNV